MAIIFGSDHSSVIAQNLEYSLRAKEMGVSPPPWFLPDADKK